MPAQINSYSLWLAAQQNPQCSGPGPTGPTGTSGNNGSTGTTGPTGPAGINGLTTGLIYYFYTEQPGSTYSPQPNVNNYGPTGFSMQTIPGVGPGLPPGNPNLTYNAFNGYLAFGSAVLTNLDAKNFEILSCRLRYLSVSNNICGCCTF